ncbi:MAG: MarR family winged helix-turn-helix transcriptional regulator [Egibacteraceae bacterium]
MDRSRELVDCFGVFGPTYMKWMRAQVGDDGLSWARMRLLHVLRTGGPQIMSRLSDDLAVTARNVTALVDALEQDDLVERRQHPDDRRATLVALTPQGEQLVRERFTAHRERAAELFARLDADEQQDLLHLMGRLTNALQEHTGIDCPAAPHSRNL